MTATTHHEPATGRDTEAALAKAATLIEALPWLHRFHGQTVVIKYGGHAMSDGALRAAFAQDVVFLWYAGLRPVVVHGGGPQISAHLDRLGMASTFEAGLRVTTPETMDVVRMVLTGQVNRDVVGLINRHGPFAVGMSGEDANLFTAARRPAIVDGEPVDLGMVGDIETVRPGVIRALLDDGRIPVISSVARGTGGEVYNVNADTAAAALAAALGAAKLVVLTDVAGLYKAWPASGHVIGQLTATALEGMLPGLTAGMIPKMEACLRAVRDGVPQAHVLDGRLPHAVLLEIFTDSGIGTMVVPDDTPSPPDDPPPPPGSLNDPRIDTPAADAMASIRGSTTPEGPQSPDRHRQDRPASRAGQARTRTQWRRSEDRRPQEVHDPRIDALADPTVTIPGSDTHLTATIPGSTSAKDQYPVVANMKNTLTPEISGYFRAGELVATELMQKRFEAALMPNYGIPPVALVRGEGCRVWDADGREYLDLIAGIAVSALGHGHPAITEAVSRQVTAIAHTSNLFLHEGEVALAERLLALLGTEGRRAEGRVFFTTSGTEANEAAFKLVRRLQGPGRPVFVAAEHGFHGRTMGALALTGKESIRTPFGPFGIDVRFVPYGDAEELRAATGPDCAAVFLEPCLGEGGVVPAPDGYLRAARQACDSAGALLVIDEIQSGIGRSGVWFAHQHEGVRPDVLTLAKGLGGGLPIGACIGFGECGTAFRKGDHGSTFGGNPVACAAALAVLDTIERDGLLARAVKVGQQITADITAMRHPLLAGVRGRGLWLAVLLPSPAGADVEAACRKAGFLVNAVLPDAIRLAPPLVIDGTQAASFTGALPAILDSVAGGS